MFREFNTIELRDGPKIFFGKKNWLATLSSGLATLSSGVGNTLVGVYDDVDNINWLPNPQF